MWWLGLAIHEAGLSLLMVFLPLYVIAIGGSLIDIGIMFAAGQLSTIPASILWGYACDKIERYKVFILISFMSLAIIMYSFTLVSSVKLLVVLYVLMSILHVAHGPPKNVLIAELYTHEEWRRNFAVYEGFVEIGRLLGLISGFMISVDRVDGISIPILCGSLHLAAFAMSVVLVKDPILMMERRLVAIERAVNLAYRGTSVLSKILNGTSTNHHLRGDGVKAFCCGLALFYLATAILFTPLPVFLSQCLTLSQGLVFIAYSVNSIGGALGYFHLAQRFNQPVERVALVKVALLRSLLAFLIVFTLQLSTLSTIVIMILLALLGYLYALFNTYTLTLSMELLPRKRIGLFDALVSLGSVCGSFIGPLIAEKAGFTCAFLMSSVTFLISSIIFKVFSRGAM
ncbi:MAG: MFS transporter [Candidatus Nezhaarchaeota archaeon]|nr:MFS transporter [Candidatus Nezhaarchaeota archaeon]MDW8049557.1 MFS transporter [Nitrososphaerota archaeon]